MIAARSLVIFGPTRPPARLLARSLVRFFLRDPLELLVIFWMMPHWNNSKLVGQISNVFYFLIPASPAALAFVALLWSGTGCLLRISHHGAGIVPAPRGFLIDHRH